MTSTAKADAPAEPTTEIALRDGTGTVAVREQFAERFPALAPDEEMLALYQENIGDETLGIGDLSRIKVPSGELNSWIVSVGGEEESRKKLRGVPIAIMPRRAFWDGDGDPDGSVPDCASTDNKTPQPGGMYARDGERGHLNPQGVCATCPMAQRGSDKNGASRCREQRLVFLMEEGGMFPTIVTVPRTSIKPLKRWAMEITGVRLPYWGALVEMGLAKASNREGTAYNQITFATAERLTPEERSAARAYGNEIREMILAQVANFSDAGAAESAGDGVSVDGASVDGASVGGDSDS